MSVFTSLGIIALSLIIIGTLQLVPGIFLLFSQAVFGQFSKKKASDMALFFILGTETAYALIITAIYIIVCTLAATTAIFDNNILAYVIGGIFAALAVISGCCYFRSGKSTGTELFISRHFANTLKQKASVAKTRSDAFILGFVSIIPELIFTLPIYVISVIKIMQIGDAHLERASLTILFVIIAILPLLIIRGTSNSHSFAELIRFRFKNKNLCRLILMMCYFIIAALTITEAIA